VLLLTLPGERMSETEKILENSLQSNSQKCHIMKNAALLDGTYSSH
jgi:hypothetical protein